MGVVFVDRGERVDSWITHNDVVNNADAVNGCEGSGYKSEGKGSGVKIGCVYCFDNCVFGEESG